MARAATLALVALLLLALTAEAKTTKLTLAAGAKRGTPVGGNENSAGSTSTYEFDLTCGQKGAMIGSCAEAGINLSKPQDYKTAKPSRQMTLWQFSCTITQKCGDVGVGTINGLGMAPAGDWTGSYPITLNVAGGTGAYESVVGGRATYPNANSIDLVLYS